MARCRPQGCKDKWAGVSLKARAHEDATKQATPPRLLLLQGGASDLSARRLKTPEGSDALPGYVTLSESQLVDVIEA